MSPITPAVVSAKDLRLQFGLQQVFNDATMSIHEGEKLGLVGRNGSGKTSLMRILVGTEKPDSGEKFMPWPVNIVAPLPAVAELVRVPPMAEG